MSLKENPLTRRIIAVPAVFRAYHFLWAWMRARVHRYPSGKIFVIGITGTKGKTTTLELLNAILEAAGKTTALLSSLRVKIGEKSEKNSSGNSMPGRGYIQKFLSDAVRARCSYALIEVTSQGVVAHRHRFVKWNMGAITNLAPEHIESHGSFENYRTAKLEFLEYVLKKGGMVFLNRDDAQSDFFREALANQDFSSKKSGGLASTRTAEFSKNDEWLLNYLPKIYPMHTVHTAHTQKFLMSEFNKENVAAAIAIAKELGVGDKVIEQALAAFAGVEGRMEFVKAGAYTAIVDYAHTPDSLEAVYKEAKPVPNANYPEPKLVCILGAAGGGRDKWKRPEMGKIAARYCDDIILTDEDPYDEDPQSIMAEVKNGIDETDFPPDRVFQVPDRKEAIRRAGAIMRAGDIVIGTGKGSEEWIHIANGKKIPWDEKKEFKEVLEEKRRREGY
jgi:UDP-N-acetylmuramoyl-L-alanyl-D-glutamate--2,6-diaminopimelate ligase